jgi:predicted metal-dependent peptidase
LEHSRSGRGQLPASLVEEIVAQAQDPIPWDVELAQWFDGYFIPLTKHRTYSRLSRRQSATPLIPRPNYSVQPESKGERTFAVVLDTSGSMSHTLIAKALGAISSYAISREVPLVRVIFCDAVPYDAGYLDPEVLSQRVQVQGRGGTVLQPAIDLLEKVSDFPDKGPVLIITDGNCDILTIKREHAFLLPEGNNLPFYPRGKIFFLT